MSWLRRGILTSVLYCGSKFESIYRRRLSINASYMHFCSFPCIFRNRFPRFKCTCACRDIPYYSWEVGRETSPKSAYIQNRKSVYMYNDYANSKIASTHIYNCVKLGADTISYVLLRMFFLHSLSKRAYMQTENLSRDVIHKLWNGENYADIFMYLSPVCPKLCFSQMKNWLFRISIFEWYVR